MTVTREVEWDDAEREWMLALAEFRAGVCSCGYHTSLTHDRSNYFTYENAFCPVCAGADRYARSQQDTDEAVVQAMGDKPAGILPRPDDGRTTYARMLHPDEVAARKAATAPTTAPRR